MPLSPDEFRKCPEISVLRASLYLFRSGAAGCRTSNSAELTEAGMNPSGAWSPALLPTAHQQLPHLTSEPSPTSLCPHSVHRAPTRAGCNSMGIITTYCLRRAELFFFSRLQKSLSFSSTLSTLFCLSLSLLCLASGHNPDFCPDGG